MDKRGKLNKILKNIKEIKIQGATNIAKSAIHAYNLSPNEATKKKLISLRPTEPMLFRVVNKLGKEKEENILLHFSEAQIKMNSNVLKIIKNKDVILTHCHSTNVIKSLINANKKGVKFEVFNTETRPLYQGRKTTLELSKNKIRVTTFVDSAVHIAMHEGFEGKKITKILLGADAILNNGDVINKVGSGLISELALTHKIPLYIVADSWKYSDKNPKIESRKYQEVWNKAPKNIKIKNPAFEVIKSKYIKFIISDLGILTPKEFVKKVKNST